jgi:membrane protein YqaA with SNARE-associated domain
MMLVPSPVFLPHASQAAASIHHSTLQIAQFVVPRAHHSLLPNWLTHLGGLGLFVVAIIDSSIVPLPLPGSTDLFLLWLIAHSGNPWLLAPIAVAGSLGGGYTTWQIGRRGGEAALHRYVPARLLGRIVGWVEHHPVLAVFLPAILPPPIPLSPFVLASGALGVSRGRFLAVFGAARALRYSLIAWLGVAYGRHVVRLWTGTLQKWSTPLLCVFVALLIGGIWMAISKARRLRKSDAAEKPALQAKAAQTD